MHYGTPTSPPPPQIEVTNGTYFSPALGLPILETLCLCIVRLFGQYVDSSGGRGEAVSVLHCITQSQTEFLKQE